MTTHGFVYIWLDRKHKRYYVGSHWGTEDDGYVCSSSWMKKAYKLRPEDFKRRIIARIYTNKFDLLTEEEHWLQMIKPGEIKPINSNPRYYNLRLATKYLWFANPERYKTVGQKISASKMGKKPKWVDPEERGRKISEGKKRKLAVKADETGSAFSEGHRARISAALAGKKQSEESQRKRSESLKLAWASGDRPRKSTIAKERRFYRITPITGAPFEVEDLKAHATSIGAPYVTLSKAAQYGTRSPKNNIERIERSWIA